MGQERHAQTANPVMLPAGGEGRDLHRHDFFFFVGEVSVDLGDVIVGRFHIRSRSIIGFGAVAVRAVFRRGGGVRLTNDVVVDDDDDRG